MTIIQDVPKDLKVQGVECLYSHLFMGHSLGLYFHEPPWITAADHRILEPGMIFTIEPGIYIPEWGGVRIEDMVLVTPDGCEVLTTIPKDLMIVE